MLSTREYDSKACIGVLSNWLVVTACRMPSSVLRMLGEWPHWGVQLGGIAILIAYFQACIRKKSVCMNISILRSQRENFINIVIFALAYFLKIVC